MKYEALLKTFIARYGLSQAMEAPLEELFQGWLEQMSQTLDPALEAALQQQASWQPVALSESGSDTKETPDPKIPKQLPSIVPTPVALPPKPPPILDDEDDEDDPLIYATIDAPTDQFPALQETPTFVGEGPLPGLIGPPPEGYQAEPPTAADITRDEAIPTERFEGSAPTPTTPPPAWHTGAMEAMEANQTPPPPSLVTTATPLPFTSSATALPQTTPPALLQHVSNRADLQTNETPEVESPRLLAANVSHYALLSPIATGGMSEILRVQDRDLNRSVAMKVMKPEHENDPILLSRFLEEAQVTAQLEHPGIVPVYEFGRLADGRFYFTMKEIKGKTLTQVIREFHEAAQGDQWGTTEGGWHLRRLLDGFKRVCEAIGYAHSHRVIHRDIKPENVVVGRHGEVLVVDWGLVKIYPPFDTPETDKAKAEAEAEAEARAKAKSQMKLTMQGDLIGTPAYMPPEQLASPNKADERSDVYSLGALLYEILAGQAPFVGYNKNAILFQMMSGPPYPPGRVEGVAHIPQEDEPLSPWNIAGELPTYATDKPSLPVGLLEICAKAMSRNPADRYANAGELADTMGEWLAGSQGRVRALEVVAEAEDRFPETWLLRTRARQLHKEAERKARDLEPWDPENTKWPIWELEEQAEELQREARQLELETEQLLKGALTHVPDLEEAHEALSIRYQKAHQFAEADGDTDAIIRNEIQLREHIGALPPTNPRREELLDYLQGDGALTLLTDPPGAHVELYRLETQRRRLTEVYVSALGQTPIKKHPLPMGSYLLTVQAEGYEPLRYPVFIRRSEHWRSIHPMTKRTHTLALPPTGSLKPNECLIPACLAWSGGDPDLHDALVGQRVWLDDFVIQANPITNAEYQGFLSAMLTKGRGDLVALFAPQDNTTYSSDETALFAVGARNSPLHTQKDIAKIAAPPDWPVIKISWFAAMAYAAWYAETTGLPWRLPYELEWEKAARGVDRRLFPWGHRFDPSWCHARDSHHHDNTPTTINRFPVDTSVYGVRHMAGNVMDWCLDQYTREGPIIINRTFQYDQAWEQSMPHDMALTPEHIRRIRRGGAWSSTGQALRATHRHWSDPHATYSAVGFRLVRPYPDKP